ncbi:hypothetical protein KY290_031005 [Solanum tuberosum]|uniref:Retrovirus-related Pol polyprotein from transposon TNT 1-94-like beta-barrel domain-containing protein n=1 Tax=Solanum tuberosum TaxID=4113 RepID=A0ABQ7U9Q7_SOLTU|nr:hypothetical protein KY290_031005 [Solanum tuberosum]
MDNGEAMEVVEAEEEEEVIPIISTIKIKVTSHSEVVNEEVEDVELTKTVNLVDNNKDNDESTLLLALKEEDTYNCSLWYLDNGASNHMCGHKHKFMEINKTMKGNVSFGDTSKIQIEGTSTILISCKGGG